ncbi:tetratricopeptide repeat protein [Janthinobacterium sp. SUN137]|uniref:tetratricopeptide repeat protein n=1 Tax=Janthinobacterium sp. SUN137 TaxID=3014789 RepID=UPI002713B0CB|nr:tetratricopeptide repeat protein [Janthinobacterium sp. SUN137]MDO8040904.1 tetratricopeptide repeat protein [Janthinobacterium sp. SUN137]
MDAIAASRAHIQLAEGDAGHWDTHMAAAEAVLRSALQAARQDTALITCLGAVLCDQGKYRDAVNVLETALKLGSTDSHTHYNLGVALAGLAKPRKAIAQFGKAQGLAASSLTWTAYFDPQAQ